MKTSGRPAARHPRSELQPSTNPWRRARGMALPSRRCIGDGPRRGSLVPHLEIRKSFEWGRRSSRPSL